MTGLSRRELLQVAAATAVLGAAEGSRAQGRGPNQSDLLRFKPVGQLTLLNFTDLHAQLVPLYFREPSVNLGVGADRGLPPHLVGEKLLEAYKLGRGSAEAYALACTDFEGLARTYGRVGGLDRMATLVKAIRACQARQLLPLVADPGWFFDTELLVLAERAGLRIHEVPVDWTDDTDSSVNIIDTAVKDLRDSDTAKKAATQATK